MGASILPITIHNGKIYFLFGKERDIDENPGWSDFGGGTDNAETFLQTACREGSEELTGFLGDASQIRKLLTKNGTFVLDYHSQTHSVYRVHIVPMKYEPMMVYYYNNNQRFLQKKLDPKVIKNSKLFEKTEIRWIGLHELTKMHKQFRGFYQNIIDLILTNKKEIQDFIKKRTPTTRKTRKNR